jgi:hypothetical protein
MKHNAFVLTAELHRQHATAIGKFMAGSAGQHMFLVGLGLLAVIIIVSALGSLFRSS